MPESRVESAHRHNGQLQRGVVEVGERRGMRAYQSVLHRGREFRLDLPDVADDSFRIKLPGPHCRDLGDRVGVIGEGEDRRLDRGRDGFSDRTRLQCGTEPLQTGVIVGEQEVVFGGEMPIERAQGHPGIGGNLFG